MTAALDVERRSLNDHLAEEVRVLLARRRLRQVDLCPVLGINQGSVSHRLSGRNGFSVHELGLLADFFGVSPAELLGSHMLNGDGGGSGAPSSTDGYVARAGEAGASSTDRYLARADGQVIPFERRRGGVVVPLFEGKPLWSARNNSSVRAA